MFFGKIINALPCDALIMIYICPVVYNDTDIWATPDGERLMISHLMKMKAGLDSDIVIGTDRPMIAHKVERSGMDVIIIPSAGGSPSLTPTGTRRTMNKLKYRVNPGSTNFGIVDFRYLFLSPETLMNAEKVFVQSQVPAVAGASTVRDHPSQWTNCLEFLQIKMLHFIDQELNIPGLPESFLTTLPFYFKWEMHNPLKGRLFKKEQEVWKANFISVDNIEKNTIDTLWFKESEKTARICRHSFPHMEGAYVAPDDFPEVDIHSISNINDDKLIRVSNIGDGKMRYIKAIPFDEKGTKFKDLVSVALPRDRQTLEFSICGNKCSGIFMVIFNMVVGGEYHLSEPFVPRDAGWRINRNNRLINIQSGSVIQGRQEMPDIYELNTAFLLLKAGMETCLDGKDLFPTCLPYVIPGDEMLYVDSLLGLLVLQTRLKGE